MKRVYMQYICFKLNIIDCLLKGIGRLFRYYLVQFLCEFPGLTKTCFSMRRSLSMTEWHHQVFQDHGSLLPVMMMIWIPTTRNLGQPHSIRIMQILILWLFAKGQ